MDERTPLFFAIISTNDSGSVELDRYYDQKLGRVKDAFFLRGKMATSTQRHYFRACLETKETELLQPIHNKPLLFFGWRRVFLLSGAQCVGEGIPKTQISLSFNYPISNINNPSTLADHTPVSPTVSDDVSSVLLMVLQKYFLALSSLSLCKEFWVVYVIMEFRFLFFLVGRRVRFLSNPLISTPLSPTVFFQPTPLRRRPQQNSVEPTKRKRWIR